MILVAPPLMMPHEKDQQDKEEAEEEGKVEMIGRGAGARMERAVRKEPVGR